MKFKKNAAYLQGQIVICSICWFALMLLICITKSADIFVVLWFLFSPGIMLLCFEIASKGGLFYDNVYCDEHGIKVVTRKKTYDCPWEQIKMLDQICGKSGPIGWTIVTYSNEQIRIMIYTKSFVRYVKKVAPDVKINNIWGVNYGVKL